MPHMVGNVLSNLVSERKKDWILKIIVSSKSVDY